MSEGFVVLEDSLLGCLNVFLSEDTFFLEGADRTSAQGHGNFLAIHYKCLFL